MTAGAAACARLVNFQKAGVLIIDSSSMSIEVLSIMLNGFGFRQISRANNIEAGIKLTNQKTFDLIFIDPYAFGEEAYSYISWVRSDQSNPNRESLIVIETAYTGIHLISVSRRCGADYVLNKPFAARTLMDRILWLAHQGARVTDLTAPSQIVSQAGSGVELW